MKDKNKTVEAALKKLVLALSGPEDEYTRLAMIEEAFHYAALVLHQEPPDTKQLRTTLLDLSVQVLADQLDVDNVGLMKLVVRDCQDENDEGDPAVTVVVTSNPMMMQGLTEVIERMAWGEASIEDVEHVDKYNVH